MWPFNELNKSSATDDSEQRSIENPSVGLGSAEAWESVFGEELGGAAGETVNADTALSVPPIWAAVNVLSSTIAALSWGVFRRNGEDKRESLSGTPIHARLNKAPNKRWTSYRWRKHMMQMVLLKGRAYTWIDRPNPGTIRALWPLDTDHMTPELNSQDELQYRYTAGDRTIIYPAEDISAPLHHYIDDQINIEPLNFNVGHYKLISRWDQ